MKLLTNGNTKVNALLFDLPVSVCPIQCPSCYAKKAEIRFPAALAKRNRNYDASLKDDFVDVIIEEIKKSKRKIVRVHSSGDFYSQQYVNKWQSIAAATYINDNKFYAYTKRKQDFDFTHIEELSNFNLIDSVTPIGYNYGNLEYCNTLTQQHGYYLCGCQKGHDGTACMSECYECLTQNKVCFLKH
jgi:hypothetical protein